MKAIAYGISVLIIVSGALFALQGMRLAPKR
jgi:TRAP-type mannitol/chloroaromatic compound transport system permease small subunit